MVKDKLVFDDVVKCGSVAEFNLFVRRYLAERGLVADGKHEDTRKTYWALFYAWSDSLSVLVDVVGLAVAVSSEE